MQFATYLRSTARFSRSRRRHGATVLELLVALVLFDMSLVTLAAVSALAVRRVGEAGRRNRAAIAASSRLELLTSQPCGAITSGMATLERGVTETWSAAQIAGGREFADSVVIDARFPEQLVLRSRVPC